MKKAFVITTQRLSLLLMFMVLAHYICAQGVDGYDITPLQVDSLPPLNIARTGHVVISHDGELIALGGHTHGFVPTATAEYYRNGAWHTVPLAYPHDNATFLKLRSGQIFMAGGHKDPLGIGQLFSAELYDPATHTSQGFGCMDSKRAYANAIEMDDGQVYITGNWFTDDSVEMFQNVYNPTFTNAVGVKAVSHDRAKPYILRVTDDDAIIFGSLDNRAIPIVSSTVDRLRGDSYHEPFLDTWRPIRTIDVERSYNQFIGSEADGRYQWLVPVENDSTGRVAIARVSGPGHNDDRPSFTLLPTQQQFPDSLYGGPVIYSSLVCDRDREIAYLTGCLDQDRMIVVAFPYASTSAAPLTVYVTDPLPMLANSVTPALTADGDLIFAGGHLVSKFYPVNSVIRLPLGLINKSAKADTAPVHDSANLVIWLCVVFICLLACAAVAVYLVRRKRVTLTQLSDKQSDVPMAADDGLVVDVNDVTDIPDVADAVDDNIDVADIAFDSSVAKDEFLTDLFQRIEALMYDERLYLNANLRASDVAVRVSSNTTYVSAAINSQRGCSFTQYLASYRIAYAQELMRQDPERKISSIIHLSGFSTDSTFFRAFRTFTGMSPKEWLSTIHSDNKQ